MKNTRMNGYRRFGWGILFALGAAVFAAVIALVFGLLLMLLWNWLMPEIFGLPVINYWQGWGLILLSHLLFKGGRGGPGHGHRKPSGFDRDCGQGWGMGGHGPCGPHGGPGKDDQWRREFRRKMRDHFADEPEGSDEPESSEETRKED